MTETSGVLHRIFEQLGGLRADVENVKGQVEIEAKTQAQHRDSMRQVIAAQTEAVRALTQQEEAWRRDWNEEWRPLLEDYRTRAPGENAYDQVRLRERSGNRE